MLKIKNIYSFIFWISIFRECTRLCEGIGLRAHTFTKINKDKEKFNPKLAQKFGKHDFGEHIFITLFFRYNIFMYLSD